MLKITGIKGLFQCLSIGMMGLALSACDDVSDWGKGSSSSSSSASSATAYSVGGTVTGLGTGKKLILLNNTTNSTEIIADGAFQFSTKIRSGFVYGVTISSQPAGQNCTFGAPYSSGGPASGIISTTTPVNITNVNITCVNLSYSLSVDVTNLKGTVTLNNGTDLLTITPDATSKFQASGTYAFPTLIPWGGSYNITLGTQPAGVSCTLSAGTASVPQSFISTDVIPNAKLNCVRSSYPVNVTVNNLINGNTLQLRNTVDSVNPALVDNKSLTGTGATINSSFTASVVTGETYNVTITGQPTGQTCSVVTNGTAKINGAAASVTINCATDTHTVGGTVTGLQPNKSVTLLNNGGNAVTVSQSNPAFTFTTPINYGSNYVVTVGTQPVGQTCSVVTAGSATMGTANVTNVGVNCTVNTYTVGGTVTGLTSGTVVLQINGGGNKPLSADGFYTFTAALNSADGYTVTILTQPSGVGAPVCALANATGTVGGANVTNVNVNCGATLFKVGGTVSGLTGGQSVTLLNNGGDSITVSANGHFDFPTTIPPGAYSASVPVGGQPTTQTCLVSNASGTIPSSGGADVTNINVDCANGTVKVALSGLGTGLSVTLTNNGGDAITLNADGNFAFPVAVASGGAYNVVVTAQPTEQTCLLSNNSETITSGDVTVTVTCSVNKYTIGGAISGLSYTAGTFVVQVSDGATVPTIQTVTIPSGALSYNITPGLVHATNYTVTVQTQPNGQTCTLANSVGATGSVNVTNVDITCVAATYTVGFTVTGFVAVSSPVTATSSTTNAVTTTNLPANGSRITFNNTGGGLTAAVNYYVFNATAATAPASGGTFQVSLTAGSTTPVTLTTATTFAPAVTGTATQLVVQNNLADDFTVTANTGGTATNTFTTATGLSTGMAYSVTVKSSSQHQTCTTGGTAAGTITNANIVVPVTCVSNEVQVSGNISGHSIGMGAGATGAILSLKVNGSSTANETLPALADNASTFAFGTYVTVGQTYAVSIDSQPSIGTATTGVPNVRNCTMYNGSGTTVGQPANNTIITCRSTDKTKLGMWVVNPTSNTMNQYTMDATGKPVLNATPILGSLGAGTPVFNNPSAVATTALNTLAFVTNAGNTTSAGTLYSYLVGAGMGVGTTLTASGTVSVPTGINPHAIAVSPTSAMAAFVTNSGDNSVSGYTIGGGATPPVTALAVTGTSVNPTPVGTSPRGLAYHPSGRWLYVVNGGSNTVQAFNVTGGGLTALNTLGTNPGTNTVATGSDPYYIAFDPSGMYAYVTNGGDHTISQYKVCQYTDLTCTQGTLSPNGSAAVGSVSPRGISVDDGNVYVVSKDGKTVSQFTIGSNGQLSATPTSTIATGNGASNIAINPAFTSGVTPVVYVTNSTDDTLQSITATAPNPLAALDSQSTLTGVITANGSTQIGISQ